MSIQALAEIIHIRCSENIERIEMLSQQERLYELIMFQVQLCRLDFRIDAYTKEIWRSYPPGAERSKLLRDLSDSRLVIHSFIHELEICVQSQKWDLIAA